MSHNKGRISTGTFFGILLIAVGILWVLHNTQAIEIPIQEWWPLALIVIGLLHLFHHRKIFDCFGWLMLGLGVVFLLTTNDIIDRHEVWKYWPVLLILVGLSIILNRRTCCRGSNVSSNHDKNEKGKCQTRTTSSEDHIDESLIFGSLNKKINTKSFKGGSISAIFSGVELDFRGAELAEEGAVLDVSAIFAGAEILIPESWPVELRSTAILGGVESKYSNPEKTSGKRLQIVSSAIFGGVDIKN